MAVQGNLAHSILIPLRWGDMDAYGHANNTVYFRFFEEARINWLASLDLNTTTEGTGPIIITAGATFLKELNYPATLEVKTYTGKAGNTSLETFHEVIDSVTGVLYAEGYAKIVWFDHQTRGSAPLPEKLRQLAL